MVFGKKKQKQPEPTEDLSHVPFQSAVDKESQGEETQPSVEELKQQIEDLKKQTLQTNPTPPQQNSKARIIGCEILDNGLWKFTFISNVPMGEMGQEFDI